MKDANEHNNKYGIKAVEKTGLFSVEEVNDENQAEDGPDELKDLEESNI